MRRTPRAEPRPASALLAGAAAFAAAEIGLAVLIGRLLASDRAEALPLLAARPWLLLAAALFVAGDPGRRRAACYLLCLAIAGLAEGLLLAALGGAPWLELARGTAVGLVLAAAIDLLLRLGGKLRGRSGRAAAAALILLWLVVPGGQRPYRALAHGPAAPRAAASRPPLLLMTGLPLVWGETGAFDPESRPAAAYRALQAEFAVRPIDVLDPASLGEDRLLLLAQPRRLAPRELVALDAWVRRGGRILILADPELDWPTRLIPGDIRRPPPSSLLSPLLDHWGLRLQAGRRGPLVDRIETGGAARRLVLSSPGRFEATQPTCRAGPRDYLAACTIGDGRALLVADADLLRDDLWADPAGDGGRESRRADNMLIVADWLDALAGRTRVRTQRPVRWQAPAARPGLAVSLAAIPILLALGAAAAIRRR